MRRKGIAAISLLVAPLLFFACDNGGGSGQEATPVETPITSVNPTELLGVRESGYTLERILPGVAFAQMLDFVPIPGFPNDAVVLTKDGNIQRVALDNSYAPQPYGDLSARLIANPGSEEGLLGLAFSPAFATDGRVYVDYIAGNPRRSVLSRFQVVNNLIDMNSERVLLEAPQPFANHNGGQLAFGPDGYLYYGLGDGGGAGDPNDNAQNLWNFLGSILRLDVSGDGYTVPPDNPFVNVAGALPEIFAYGLRNPWRFSFDRVSGELWAGDVGQFTWEEVDRIQSGGNYGWPVVEGFECYRQPNCDRDSFILPRVVYGHDEGCAIIGGSVYRGAILPELQGRYIYGDYCSGRVWAVETEGDSSPVLLANSGRSITSITEAPDGELVFATFDNALFILRKSN